MINFDLGERFMKKSNIISKVYLSLQIIFTVLTFVGAILLFMDKIDNAGMSVCCMCMTLIFKSYYDDSKKSEKLIPN